MCVYRQYSKVSEDIVHGELQCYQCSNNCSGEGCNWEPETCMANCTFNNDVYHYKCFKTIEDIKSLKNLENLVIENVEGCYKGSDTMKITFTNGMYVIFKYPDVFSNVDIDDVNGDVETLIGQRLLKLDVRMSNEMDNNNEPDYSKLWTFYTFATVKGYVDVKWYGSSNGWYSVCVDWKIYDANNEEILTSID